MNEFYDILVRNLDTEKITAEVLELILKDKERFLDRAYREIIGSQYGSQSYFNVQQLVHKEIVGRLADHFMANHGQEVLAKIDIAAVLNAIPFRAASRAIGESAK